MRSLPLRVLLLFFLVCLSGITIASLLFGETAPLSCADLARGLLALFGSAEQIPQQAVFELRLWRSLVVIAVGASLALAGALLQGLFRNSLASPSLLGVSAGASLGATLAVLLRAEPGPAFLVGSSRAVSLLVPLCAFAGATLITSLVFLWMLRPGPRSLSTLLLVGVALTSLCGGISAMLLSFALDYGDVSRAIVEWGFGTFEDRSPDHVLIVWTALAAGSLSLPFLHRELDLLAMGEADAQSLGVRPRVVRMQVVLLSSLLTAAAVSVAGQIAFVGLIIPNLVRALVGPGHGRLLPLASLTGAAFLLGLDAVQKTWAANLGLRPGILMSLVGAPFFLLLLLRARKELGTW
ncbi:MAG: FecCD family ABC transporter permease [Planctomycetota bacterium]